MGKRGPAIKRILLARIYKLLSNGHSIAKVARKSKAKRRTVYRYAEYLVREGSLKRIGKSPAIYHAQPSGYKYERMLEGPENLAREPENLANPTHDGGRPESPECTPLRPLDLPSRIHHSAYHCRILKQPDQDSPLLKWSDWINLQNKSKYRKAAVLLDIGVVTLFEFPERTMRIFLPDRVVNGIQEMNDLWQDEAKRAQKVANWLRKQGYGLGLPEQTQALEIPAEVPQLDGQFQGMIIVKNPDGTQTHIDMSKGWVEVENQLRSCNNRDELEKSILWAMGPSMLQALVHKMDTLDLVVRALVADALEKLLPEALARAMDSAQVKETVDKNIKEAVDKSFEYTPKDRRGHDVDWM